MNVPKRTIRALLSANPDLQQKNRLLFVVPVNRILRGLYLEESASLRGHVYVWAFVQPLYVPSDSIVLSLGRRLGGGTRTWRLGDQQLDDDLIRVIRDEGAPFFRPAASASDFIRWLEAYPGGESPFALEALGYSLVISHRLAESHSVLKRLQERLAGTERWVVQTKERVAKLDALASSRPEEAENLISAWEIQTREKLKLPLEVP